MEDLNWGDDYDEKDFESIFQISPVKEEIDFGDEDGEDNEDDKIFTLEPVTPKDLLKFAKRILIWLGAIFLFIAIIHVSVHSEETKQLWNFSTTACNSLASIVIGYYFAKKGD